MNAITRIASVAVLVALGLTLTAWAAEPLPLARRSLLSSNSSDVSSAAGSAKEVGEVGYGHKDFVPTPERPVYFRQTYGNYPGATPPLEWWEGTPTTRKVKVGDSRSSREAEVVDFADQKSKNILWKVPVPGWSLSHPVVVGNPSTGSGQGRVFAVGEPDFVTCWDLDTGKQLWQRRIMPLLCDGLPEEKAAAGQKVLDLARAFFYIGTKIADAGAQDNNLFNSGWNKDGSPENQDHAAFVAEKKAMAQKLLDAFAPHRPEVEALGDAALLAALDQDLEILKRFQTVADLEALKILKKENKRPTSLIGACLKVLGVDIGGAWWGFVGTADSTLASDGQRIYGVFDQGQVFALDLDGKTVWLQREKGKHDNRPTFHRSPLLCGDPAGDGTGLLLVRSIHMLGRKRSDTDNGGVIFPLRALDVKTGQVRWEVPLAGSNYTVPRLMRLPGADGKPVAVLLGDTPESKDQGQAVVRVTDGKILGHLPYNRLGRGAIMAVLGQQVTWYADGGLTCSYRLRLDDVDTVVAEKIFVMESRDSVFGGNDFPTVTGTIMLNASDQLRDATTGALISKLPGRVGRLGVVAGHYLITLATEGGWHGDLNNSSSRRRDDRMTFGVFKVIDIKDPAKPVMVAKNNLLGYKEPAADIIVSTYFKEFDPFDFAGCYKGSAGYFAMMGGPVPAGNKLLIQSSAFLYCIGLRQGSGPQVGEK